MVQCRCWFIGSFRQLPLPREEGISTLLVAVFMGLVVAPTLALAIEIGRYAETRTLIQQAADLAALAAAQEADVTTFEEAGVEVLLTSARGVAQSYIYQNLTRAAAQKVTVTVRNIAIEGNTATCDLDADVSELFPKFVGHVTIRVKGVAEFRFTHDGSYTP